VTSNSRPFTASAVTVCTRPAAATVIDAVAAHGSPASVAQITSTGIVTRSPARTKTGGV
jgi:hypothetical protein